MIDFEPEIIFFEIYSLNTSNLYNTSPFSNYYLLFIKSSPCTGYECGHMFTGTATLGTQQLTTAWSSWSSLVCCVLTLATPSYTGAGELSHQPLLWLLLKNVSCCNIDVCLGGFSACKVVESARPSQQSEAAWFQHDDDNSECKSNLQILSCCQENAMRLWWSNVQRRSDTIYFQVLWNSCIFVKEQLTYCCTEQT